tara:strand:- start:17 stop:580 length:564 start_codon:yes stop_codon:yes gene_type:complete
MQEVEIYYVSGKYPVFTTFLNHSSEEIRSIKERIIQYRKEHPKSNESNVKAWHSFYGTHRHTNYFDDINRRITSECDIILNKFNHTKDRLILHDMWMNIYHKGDRTLLHNHFPGDYSCCYYVDIEENSSPIKFPPKLEILPKNDMLVIFPGIVFHEVLPTNGKRIMIAMNLDYPRRPPNSPTFIEYS